MAKPPSPQYSKLITAINLEIRKGLENIERLVQQQKVVTYWNVGELILKETKGAKAPARFYSRLSSGTGIDERTLQQCGQFAREYPKLDKTLPLTWSHYRFLMQVTSPAERLRWQKRILKEDLKTSDLKALLIAGSPAAKLSIDENKFQRGQLYTYRVIKVDDTENLFDGYRVDCGFNVRILPPPCDGKIDNSRIVESRKDERGEYSLRLSRSTVKDVYTFKAKILRAKDGDTFEVEVDCGFKTYIEQTLRLRGIDAPELRTKAGERALVFVKKELEKCRFVVIKTYKSDKYDRYLTDLFYDPKLSAAQDVADKGKLLNAELLKAGYAVTWSP